MPDRPNIVFLFPDQLRRDFLGCYGSAWIDTPNIDRLAREGIRYDGCYSASPVCVPARTSLLTGMNAIHNGVTDNNHALRGDYGALGIRTWPELLREAGYDTAAVGKMHFYPWDAKYGFQYRVAAEDKVWVHVRDEYGRYLREQGLRKLKSHENPGYYENDGAVFSSIPWEHSVDRFVGREACRYIRNYGNPPNSPSQRGGSTGPSPGSAMADLPRSQRGTEGDLPRRPFALMVGFPGPHPPYDPSPDFPGLKAPGKVNADPGDVPPPIPFNPGNTPRMRQAIVDRMKVGWHGIDHSQLDDYRHQRIRTYAGALVEQIDHEVGEVLRALEETGQLENTVIIFSTDHGDYIGDHGMVGKSSFYESAAHVPMIVRPAGGAASARTSADLVELTDVTATMLSLAGAKVPAYMDSRPLPGLGLPNAGGREHLVGMLTDGWMLYDGEWKLAKYANGEQVLFNLKEDPQEQRNRIADPGCADIRKRLDAVLTGEIMAAMEASVRDRISGANAQDPEFGAEGWRRLYPQQELL